MYLLFESAGFVFTPEQIQLLDQNDGPQLHKKLEELVAIHHEGGMALVKSCGNLLLKENFSPDNILFQGTFLQMAITDIKFFSMLVSPSGIRVPVPTPEPEPEPPRYEHQTLLLYSEEDYLQAFKEMGLEHHWAFFKPHLKAEVRLRVEASEEAQISVGQTKIGGFPDLPWDMEWPAEANGAELAFLAQINFAEMDHTKIATPLPHTGICYFFYSGTQDTWEATPESDKIRVFYRPNPEQLTRRSFPALLHSESHFKPCKVDFIYGFSLPNREYDFVREVLHQDERYPYLDISVGVGNDLTKLLGHSYNVQGPCMEFECEFLSRGYTWKDVQDPVLRAEMESHRDEWTLFFELNSENAANMCWGDVGMLYFWIRKSDLEKHAFEKCSMILQCT